MFLQFIMCVYMYRYYNNAVFIRASETLSMFRKCLKTYFFINSNCFEMTDIGSEFNFSVIHVLISVYVLD